MNPSKPVQLPNRRWLSRQWAIQCVGSRRELERMQALGIITPEYPAGCKHKRYIRAELIAAVEGRCISPLDPLARRGR